MPRNSAPDSPARVVDMGTGKQEAAQGSPETCLPIRAWRALLFVVHVKHPVCQCFFLVILFFKNH